MSTHRPSLQRYFVSGLITLLPLWLTVIVFRFVFVLLSDISRPWITPLLARLANQFPLTLGWLGAPWVQTALALIATLAVIIGVGVMAHRVLGQRLLRWFEAGIQRVPLANLVYGAVRKLIDFPHRDMKAIGFVTRVLREEGSERELAAVYVPTTPNPTSGYLEVVPVDDLTPTDWTVDQAMSFIISGGAVSPETVPFTRSADRNAVTTPDEAAADGKTPPSA